MVERRSCGSGCAYLVSPDLNVLLGPYLVLVYHNLNICVFIIKLSIENFFAKKFVGSDGYILNWMYLFSYVKGA